MHLQGPTADRGLSLHLLQSWFYAGVLPLPLSLDLTQHTEFFPSLLFLLLLSFVCAHECGCTHTCLCLWMPVGNAGCCLVLLSFFVFQGEWLYEIIFWQLISLEDQGPGVFPSYAQRSHLGVIFLPWSHVTVSEDIFCSYICRKGVLLAYYHSFNCGSEGQLKLRVLRVRKRVIAGASSCQWGLGLGRELGLFCKMSQGRLCGHVLFAEGVERMWLLLIHTPPPCLTLSSRTQLCGLNPTLYNLRSTATPALRITVTSTRTSWKEPRVPGEGKASACDRNRDLAVKDNVAEVTFPRSLGIYLL